MRFKAIIFDIDGTLVDSLGAYMVAFNRGVARFGLIGVEIKLLADKLGQGMTLEQILLSCYPDCRDDRFLAACSEAVIDAFRDADADIAPLFPPVSGVLETLSSRGLKFGIATGRSTPAEQTEIWLKSIGIGQYFEAVVTAHDVPARKPAPDSVIECSRRLGISASDCLMVGDSVDDVIAARAAGAEVVAVLTGLTGLLHRDKLASLEPLGILEDLSGLTAFLESLSEARGDFVCNS